MGELFELSTVGSTSMADLLIDWESLLSSVDVVMCYGSDGFGLRRQGQSSLTNLCSSGLRLSTICLLWVMSGCEPSELSDIIMITHSLLDLDITGCLATIIKAVDIVTGRGYMFRTAPSLKTIRTKF